MKPKNFPGRKLRRKIIATYGAYADQRPKFQPALDEARAIRTKKDRSARKRP